MSGPKTGNTKVNGNTIRCMEKEKSLGLTGECMKDSMKTIKNTEPELSTGQMEENTSAAGKKENSMAEDSTIWPMARKK